MRPCRGMGAVSPSKMPKAKTITRKDNPNKVTKFASGGKAHPADIDGGYFVRAAAKYGLDTDDNEVLNKIVRLVTKGESVDAAAKQVAEEMAV